MMPDGPPLTSDSKAARKQNRQDLIMDAATIAGWDTHHDWMIRDLEMDPGIPLMLHQCRRCGRNFVTEPRTGDQYAVHVDAMGFSRLSEEMTTSWVAASCPGEKLESDAIDLASHVLSSAAESRSLRAALPIARATTRGSPIGVGAAIKRRKRA
jgi:hypothetical protein